MNKLYYWLILCWPYHLAFIPQCSHWWPGFYFCACWYSTFYIFHTISKFRSSNNKDTLGMDLCTHPRSCETTSPFLCSI